jgi:hypothetical protein
MRIRTILTAAAAPAIIVGGLLASTVAASASTGPHGFTATPTSPGNSSIVKQQFTYDDAGFGWVQLNEILHPAHGKQGQIDSISGTFINGDSAAAHNWVPGQVVQENGMWASDFSTGVPVGTITVTINATGTGFDGQATYPAS